MKNEIKECVRNLRKNMTPAECLFWKEVRGKKFLGKRFLRQHPIIFEYEGMERFFVADFYCHEEMLVIEIDGMVHEDDQNKLHDEIRTEILERLGYNVLRFSNAEIESDMCSVLGKLEHPPRPSLKNGGRIRKSLPFLRVRLDGLWKRFQ